MSKSSYSVPYILWWNDRPYEVDKEVFARFSKKFKRDLEKPDNQNQMDIVVNNARGERVEEDTFIAFVNACQLKPFDVNKRNVYDLLHLASERQWDVASLRAYIDDYIIKNKIDPPEVKDYLQILLDHVESEVDTKEDWENVANNINGYLADDRFEMVPPDVIYEILDIADKKGLSSDGLVNFVKKMLVKNPDTAIPLLLRVDFEKFTPDDLDRIYTQPEVHSLNINFFTASALSALQNKNTITIQKRKRQQILEFKCLEYALDKMCEDNRKQIETEYRDEVDEIKDEIFRQQAIIDKLRERIDEHQRRVALAEKKQLSRRTPLDAKALQDMHNAVRFELRQMENELDQALNAHDAKMQHFVVDAQAMAEKFFTEEMAKSSNQITQVQSQLNQLIDTGKDLQQDVDAVNWQLGEARKSLCAKIVRDKIRYDKFLRKTTNRFRIFDQEPRLFNLAAADIKKAEEFIVMVDKRVDSYCPLRQQDLNAQNQAPVPKRKRSQK